jgi:hypothetical protein
MYNVRATPILPSKESRLCADTSENAVLWDSKWESAVSAVHSKCAATASTARHMRLLYVQRAPCAHPSRSKCASTASHAHRDDLQCAKNVECRLGAMEWLLGYPMLINP